MFFFNYIPYIRYLFFLFYIQLRLITFYYSHILTIVYDFIHLFQNNEAQSNLDKYIHRYHVIVKSVSSFYVTDLHLELPTALRHRNKFHTEFSSFIKLKLKVRTAFLVYFKYITQLTIKFIFMTIILQIFHFFSLFVTSS